MATSVDTVGDNSITSAHGGFPAEGPAGSSIPSGPVPEPSPEVEARFLIEVTSAMVTSASMHAGLEQALAATCRFIGRDIGAAYLLGRREPHEICNYVAVDATGEPVPMGELTGPVRAAMLALDDDDGILVVRAPADAAAARRLMARNGRVSLRTCRWIVDDDHAAMVSFAARTRRSWEPWQLRVLRVVSRLIAHSLARASLEERLRRQRDALAASEARWRDLLQGLHAAVVRVDRDGAASFASDEITRFGLDPNSIVGLHYREFLPASMIEEVEPYLGRAFAGERVETRLRLQTRRGELWCELRIAPELDDRGEVSSLLVLAFDATERGRSEERVARAASTDSLTGLANRSVLVDELERSLSSARAVDHQLALLFIDLDRFKRVNDTHGHVTGDELLRQVAMRLRTLVRADDTVARLGGDEFAVLVKHVRSVDEIERLVEKLRAELARPFEVNGHLLQVSGSVGATLSSPEDVDATDLLRCADHAMYQAKHAGRNRWQVFDDEMRAALRDRIDMEEALRRAIDDESIDVHYLPEVDLSTGRVVAVEALARWRHHELGLLPASAFVGLAEDAGLIADLGAHVLHTACRAAATWSAHDPALVLRVNLSARQLGIPRLVGDIAQALLRSGMDARRLAVEVSERALAADPEAVLDGLLRISQLGVSVSLDDIGTGHSTFTYLERLPVAALKIDRRFVGALTSGLPRDRRIVENFVRLGEALGVDVIAEGVERPAQLELLRAMGVTRAQGHLFAQPAPASAIPEILRRSFADR